MLSKLCLNTNNSSRLRIMEENHTDLSSLTIKNHQNNNFKELKIILDRNDFIVNTYLNNTKFGIKNNNGIKEETHENNLTESDMKIHTKLLDKVTVYKKRKYSELSQQSIFYKKKYSVYTCDVCGDIYQSMRALTHHIQFHKKSISVVFTCALCGEMFETNDDLIHHKIIHDSEDHCFKCTKCKLAYTNHHDFIQHISKHLNTDIYKCIECSRTFTFRKTYKNHISTHYLKEHKCNICEEIFTQKKDLGRHKRNHHNPGIDCVECGKNNQTTRDHKEHMTIHTGVKLFQCLYCGKGYSKQCGKRDHMRKMHTKYSPYECNICSEGFYNASQLKIHMIVHETKKKYECNDCGRQFFHRYSIIQHVRRHMNYMLYDCPLCKRSYTTYQNLVEHTERAHVNMKRFKCELCNVSFNVKRSYRYHLQRHMHRNRAYAANLSEVKLRK